MDNPDQQSAIFNLFSTRRGHFLLESGHHGEIWLDLELLCRQPADLKPLAVALTERLAPFGVDAVCGPLIEGAFVGLIVTETLGCEFAYSVRYSRATADGLFPAAYRVPGALRRRLQNKRIALVNDVINAGSAVKGTFADLQACGAEVVAIAALLVLGDAAASFATENKVSLISLSMFPNQVWAPPSCPLCAASVPLEDVEGFSASTAN